MTNLYLSKQTCNYFKAEILKDISPEVAYWHWFVHVFELAGSKHMIFMEEQSLYSVVVFGIIEDLDVCINSFEVKLDKQLRQDKFVEEDIRLALNILAGKLAYPTPFAGREMTMINHLVRKLKEVYDETKSPAEVKRYSEVELNEIPWKTIGFRSPKEMFRKQLDRFGK